jgi:uncharacterized membrane protein YfcA
MSFSEYPMLFWFCAVPAVMLFGLSKAGFGSGIGILATPLLTLTIPVTQAVGLLLPLLIITDIFALLHYRNRFDKRNIVILLPSACIGIGIGFLLFDRFSGSQRTIQIFIGTIALLFVLFEILRSFIMGAVEKRRLKIIEGIFLGATGGFTSTLAHAGGPPVVIYLLPQKLEKSLFVGTTVIFFAAVNFLKLLPYYFLGLLNTVDIKTVLVLAPLTYAGVRLGIFLNRRFSDLWFNRVVYAILLMTGLQLVLGRNLLSLIF